LNYDREESISATTIDWDSSAILIPVSSLGKKHISAIQDLHKENDYMEGCV